MKFFAYGNLRAPEKARIKSWIKGLDPVIKRMIIMRINLVAFLISITIMNVCASVHAQSISLNFKQASLTDVLLAIKKQSGFQFLYNNSEIKNAKPVSVTIKNAALKDALDQVFKGQPLNYQILDKTIVVKEKPEKPSEQNRNNHEQLRINGKVLDESGNPLPGVNIRVKGTALVTSTDSNGLFSIDVPEQASVLQFSFVGYQTVETTLKGASLLSITMKVLPGQLEEVGIISTGYQDIPKERVTGSFVKIDNNLINRSTGTNIVSRLQGVTSGLLFNANTRNTRSGSFDLNVRGRSTIFANDQPLIVVDNFPYDSSLDNINPNDIESITLLRDAAAASIWGARAGNGVIVITTKKGLRDQPLKISLNTNVTFGDKPDLFYNPNYLSSPEFIEVEKDLFTKGFYNNLETATTKPVLSPVVELLIKRRDGTLPAAEADRQIEQLKSLDVRNDFEKLVFKNSLDQQHALNLSGGNQTYTYYVSMGYDRNLANLVNNKFQRYTLSLSSTFNPVKNLEIAAIANLSSSNNIINNTGFGNNPRLSNIRSSSSKNIYPYAQFADDQGNALPIIKDNRYAYITTLSQLLNWEYRPLDEISLADNEEKNNLRRLNFSARYQFVPELNVELKYQNENQSITGRNYYDQQTYFTRNLINSFSSIAGGIVTRNIPLGGILDQTGSNLNANSFRGQLNFSKRWNEKHRVTALGGAEVKEIVVDGLVNRLYGYDDEHATSSPVNYVSTYPQFITGSAFTIPRVDDVSQTTDRYTSVYGNASYDFMDRYIVTMSARKDASNLFGVNSNQKGVPLWSTGLRWNISNESFYKSKWLPVLNLRVSYGYNGNIDKGVTAYTTAVYGINVLGMQSAIIRNPANPNLSWERINIANIGVDFGFYKNIINGSLEIYQKRGLDIIGNFAMPPASGFSTLRGNLANTRGNGFDLILNSANLRGAVNWTTNFLFSHATDKITKYTGPVTSVRDLVSYSDGVTSLAIYPLEGRPLYALYSYKWAGLDPENGDPQGFVNGTVSKAYGVINGNNNLDDLVYHGSSRPIYFGSLRNTIAYHNFSLSANVVYKLGYYFRSSSISYDDLFTSWTGHKDFTYRWQKKGDELITNVPSMIYPNNTERDFFYNRSEVTVEKADHIRLQDISLTYTISNTLLKALRIRNLGVYLYANNLGILWRENKKGIDPDANIYPNPKTYSLGLKADF